MHEVSVVTSLVDAVIAVPSDANRISTPPIDIVDVSARTAEIRAKIQA